ncbi:unnamed protein product [Notodromas monacha]|uniref:RNA-directed DNA polymerase n=1 Tax=Notodromas monacha TaxID=399045 RepID=A0A7R9GG62_9CRUS|nr:unnamed protein product [Notodromas monacha]CAG0919867.1 unnamed protein product [Notodromas monacha]
MTRNTENSRAAAQPYVPPVPVQEDPPAASAPAGSQPPRDPASPSRSSQSRTPTPALSGSLWDAVPLLTLQYLTEAYRLRTPANGTDRSGYVCLLETNRIPPSLAQGWIPPPGWHLRPFDLQITPWTAPTTEIVMAGPTINPVGPPLSYRHPGKPQLADLPRQQDNKNFKDYADQLRRMPAVNNMSTDMKLSPSHTRLLTWIDWTGFVSYDCSTARASSASGEDELRKKWIDNRNLTWDEAIYKAERFWLHHHATLQGGTSSRPAPKAAGTTRPQQQWCKGHQANVCHSPQDCRILLCQQGRQAPSAPEAQAAQPAARPAQLSQPLSTNHTPSGNTIYCFHWKQASVIVNAAHCEERDLAAPPPIIIPLQIGSTVIPALIDTGASHAFIAQQLAGAAVDLAKSTFLAKKTIFLGHEIDQTGTRALDKDLDAVRCFPKPETTRQMQRFLGMATYLPAHLPTNFATSEKVLRQIIPAKPATRLLWTPEAQEAFSHLKDILANLARLEQMDPACTTKVHCDASSTSLGAILVQLDKEGHLHVLEYASRTLSDTESWAKIVYKPGRFLKGPDALSRVTINAAEVREVLDEEQQHQIIDSYHQEQGHAGWKKIYQTLKQRFKWKSLRQDVWKRIQCCKTCFRYNAPTTKVRVKLEPIMSSSPRQQLTVDFYGPLPTSTSGHRYAIVAVDHYSQGSQGEESQEPEEQPPTPDSSEDESSQPDNSHVYDGVVVEATRPVNQLQSAPSESRPEPEPEPERPPTPDTSDDENPPLSGMYDGHVVAATRPSGGK